MTTKNLSSAASAPRSPERATGGDASLDIGEYHQRDGWYFKRLADGSVRIRHQEYAHVIPGIEWDSIVREVSANDANRTPATEGGSKGASSTVVAADISAPAVAAPSGDATGCAKCGAELDDANDGWKLCIACHAREPLEKEVTSLTAQLEEARREKQQIESREMSAIDGRRQFRDALREARAALAASEARERELRALHARHCGLECCEERDAFQALAVSPSPAPTPEPADDEMHPEYGITWGELRERIASLQRGEGIPHAEAVDRFRAQLGAAPTTETTPDPERDRIVKKYSDSKIGYSEMKAQLANLARRRAAAPTPETKP